MPTSAAASAKRDKLPPCASAATMAQPCHPGTFASSDTLLLLPAALDALYAVHNRPRPAGSRRLKLLHTLPLSDEERYHVAVSCTGSAEERLSAIPALHEMRRHRARTSGSRETLRAPAGKRDPLACQPRSEAKAPAAGSVGASAFFLLPRSAGVPMRGGRRGLAEVHPTDPDRRALPRQPPRCSSRREACSAGRGARAFPRRRCERAHPAWAGGQGFSWAMSASGSSTDTTSSRSWTGKPQTRAWEGGSSQNATSGPWAPLTSQPPRPPCTPMLIRFGKRRGERTVARGNSARNPTPMRTRTDAGPISR